MSALTYVAKAVQHNFLIRLYKHYIIDSILIVKQSGFKVLIRRRGWKFFGVIVTYYLVRDTLLYLVLPFCVARGVF